jgi:predicted acyl esterase
VFLAQDTAHRWKDYELEGSIAGAFGNAWANYWIPPQYYRFIRNEGLAPYYYDWLEHDRYAEYWKQWSIRTRYEQINVPALHIGGWYDIFLEGADRRHRHPHCPPGSAALGGGISQPYAGHHTGADRRTSPAWAGAAAFAGGS